MALSVCSRFGLFGISLLAVPIAAYAQANSWTNAGGGNWEDGANWSIGAPPSVSQSAILISNGVSGGGIGFRTVTINGTNSSTLTISNLTIGGSNVFNTLKLTNGVLDIKNALMMTNSALQVTNSVLSIDGLSGGALTIDGNAAFFGGGALTIFSGQVLATQVVTTVGNGGSGALSVLGGTVQAGATFVGLNAGSQGTITVSGGSLQFAGPLIIGSVGGGMGRLWIAGGQVILTNAAAPPAGSGFNVDGTVTLNNGAIIATNVPMRIGNAASGTFNEIGGQCRAGDVRVGNLAASRGQIMLAAGTMTATNFVIGASSCAASSIVVIVGGGLFVTNSAHTAILEIRSGDLLLNDGTLVVDQLVATNACASFKYTGGTLVIAGVTNTLSGFRITALAREGNNMRITWMSAGGRTNIVQATNGSGGNFVTNFVNLSPSIVLPGSGDVTTNYLDVGGATNSPSCYYRVRLVP